MSNLEWCTPKENVLYSSHLMKHEREKCKKSSTGYKYIGKYICHGKPKYRVQIKKDGKTLVSKLFNNIEDAIAYRNEVLNAQVNT